MNHDLYGSICCQLGSVHRPAHSLSVPRIRLSGVLRSNGGHADVDLRICNPKLLETFVFGKYVIDN